MGKKQQCIMTSVETIRQIVLDMREGDVTRGNREHNLDRLDREADKIETFVTGHGTGEPDIKD